MKDQSLLSEIKKRFDADQRNALSLTTHLRQSDFFLIGQVIQLYCYADLNARRLIDALQDASCGPDARNASRLRDARVFPELRKAANCLWASNLKDGVIKACDAVDMYRVHRHNFAHWAARRVVNEEALVLFTRNAREAERRGLEMPPPSHVNYAIVHLGWFPQAVEDLDGHSAYLAESAAHVDRHLDEFRQKFAELTPKQ